MVALTHVHPDHQGVAKDVCEARGVPLACHADDVEAMEGRRPVQEAATRQPGQPGDPARSGRAPIQGRAACSQEGDEVAGFRVVHAPGHARGEVIFFRERDRVAICGDVIRNMSYATGLPGHQGAAGDLHLRPGREPPLDPQAGRSQPHPDPPRPRPRRTDMAAFEHFVAALPG